MESNLPQKESSSWREIKMTKKVISGLALLGVAVLTFFCYWFFLASTKNNTEVDDISYRAETYSLTNANNFSKAEELVKNKLASNQESCNLNIDLVNIYLEKASVLSAEKENSALLARNILLGLEKEKKCVSDRWYNFIGYSYEVLNDLGPAESYYDKGLSLYPDSVELLFQKGHLLWLKGEEVDSIGAYLEAEKKLGSDVTDKTSKGKLALALASYYGSNGRDFQRAEEYFMQAVSLIDSNRLRAEAYFGLSTLNFYYKDNLDDSSKYALEAIKTDPQDDLGYIAFARVKIKQLAENNSDKQQVETELKAAGEQLNKALTLNPQRTIAHLWQGKLAFLAGDTAGALGIFDRALGLVGTDLSLSKTEKGLMEGEIYFAKGVVFQSMSNQAEAENYFKKAFGLNPVKTIFMLQQMKIDSVLLKS